MTITIAAIEKQSFSMLIEGQWFRTSTTRAITILYDGTQVRGVYLADGGRAEPAILSAQAGRTALRR
jgi:hypothetical protein